MKLSKGDYVVVSYDESKKALAKVREDVKGKVVNVVIADRFMARDDARHMSLPVDSVLAILGPHTDGLGSVFGVRIEPWREALDAQPWGDVNVYRRIEKNEADAICGALRWTAKKLNERGLDGFLPGCDIDIRPAKGKYAGTYAYRGNRRDTMTIHSVSLREEPRYLVAHESGHGVWYRLLDDEQRIEWIDFYRRLVQIKECDSASVRKLAQRFVKGNDTIKEFSEALEGEEATLFDEMLHYVVSKHFMSRRHLDLFVATGRRKALLDLFPNRDMLLSDLGEGEPLVSDYAMTKPEELFAEAFAFELVGRELPESISKLLEATLAAAANRGGKVRHKEKEHTDDVIASPKKKKGGKLKKILKKKRERSTEADSELSTLL